MILKAQSLVELETVAEKFLPLIKEHKYFAFDAPMGSGKTTFISTLLKKLGVVDEITSPTYGYVNGYDSDYGNVYHFDVYRLEDEMEAYDIGIEDYFDGKSLCLIEWPEKIENLLPENTVWIKISVEENQDRTFEIKL